MSETVNIGEIANKLSADIFDFFHWKSHPLRDMNFDCENPNHTYKKKSSTKKGSPEICRKKSHPGDVIFFYEDPYLGKRIYLHTDLKSYGKKAISSVKLRAAIESLAMTVDCARSSIKWREKYSVAPDEDCEVRGLLFVHNHDKKFTASFASSINGTDLSSIPIEANVYIHFLGPEDINRLFTIANDIVRLKWKKTLPEKYSFYYPDLVMWHRKGAVYNQPGTVEAITAPYFIINYEETEKSPGGFLIYYNRSGSSVEEFEYFIDSLSRYQMLDANKLIRIRLVAKELHADWKSNFHAAKQRYTKSWGFDSARKEILDEIAIDRVQAVSAGYEIAEIGWREVL